MNNNGAKNLIQEIDDDFVKLAEENTVKVRFLEAQSHHRPEDDISVVYELSNGFKPSSRDWIGLYSGRVFLGYSNNTILVHMPFISLSTGLSFYAHVYKKDFELYLQPLIMV